MNTVYCPLLDGQISGTDCLITVDVANGMLNPRVLPDGIEWNDEQRQKCVACPYHDDV